MNDGMNKCPSSNSSSTSSDQELDNALRDMQREYHTAKMSEKGNFLKKLLQVSTNIIILAKLYIYEWIKTIYQYPTMFSITIILYQQPISLSGSSYVSKRTTYDPESGLLSLWITG